jgi:hypothetical protein
VVCNDSGGFCAAGIGSHAKRDVKRLFLIFHVFLKTALGRRFDEM